LLLAMMDLPDFGTSLGRIADSTATMAGRKVRDGGADLQPKIMADVKQTNAHEAPLEKHGGARQGNGPVLSKKPDFPQKLPTPANRPAPAHLRRVKGS